MVSVLSICLVVTISSFCHVVHYPEPDMERSAAWSAQQKKHYWQRRCLVVADDADLSQRQTEVLLLLAKGRNSRYIEHELNISSSTAKTHIYNIYQKVGVHTRQELISRIEKTRLFEEGNVSERSLSASGETYD
jgi:DNA-binding NarL/FixJ family response regulator